MERILQAAIDRSSRTAGSHGESRCQLVHGVEPMWYLQDRMRKLYRRLRVIEKAMQEKLTAPQLTALQIDLEFLRCDLITLLGGAAVAWPRAQHIK